jgi:hypothetical protein
MLSFRLLVQSDRMGAVNLYSLYSRHPAAFDEHSCAVGTVLAAHAAIAMSAAREHERADQVEDALRSSREIEPGDWDGGRGAGSWRGDPGRGVRDAALNRPGFARGWGSGHLAPLGDGVSIHDFTFNRCQVVD